jgi:sugar lactone lactonase YvrE
MSERRVDPTVEDVVDGERAPGPSVVERRLIAEGIGFAEAPRWHDGRLWFSDIPRGVVCRLTDEGGVHEVCRVPGRPSGLGWLPDGRMIVVSMHDRVVYRWDGKRLELHADLRPLVAADLNDMVVGPDGTAYVTGFGYDAEAGHPRTPTGVVLVRPDGSAEMQRGDLYRPNGCALTPDGSWLIVAQTRVHRLSAQPIGPDGRLGEVRDIADLPSGSWADGICLDADGAIWVADPKGHRVFRVGRDGAIDRVVDMGDSVPVACVLGGPERRTLFLTLAPIRPMSEAVADPQGRIEAFDVLVPGAGRP